MGKAGAHLISKRTNKKRTTVYSGLDSLINKGLVSVEKGKNSSVFSANNPESILLEIENEKNHLRKKEAVAQEFIRNISALIRDQQKNIPKIKYVEGLEGVKQFLHQSTPLWTDSISQYDNIWWGYQDHAFVDSYRTWLDEYWDSKPDRVKIHLFSNQSEIETSLDGKIRGRRIKTIAAHIQFTSTIWICGDYIIMIVARYRPHYAVQVYDAAFSANLRSLFQVFWDR